MLLNGLWKIILNTLSEDFQILGDNHIVAVKDNKFIGFTGAELKCTRTAYLMNVYVETKHHKKGVKKIDLRGDSNNKEGRNTWVALGYKTISEILRKQI